MRSVGRRIGARLVESRFVGRLTRSIAVAFGVSCASFAVLRFIPGDPVLILLGERATPDAIAEARRSLGLEGSIPEQFWSFLHGLAQRDLGTSYVTRQPVWDIVARSLPVTLELIGFTLVLCMAMSTLVGLVAALARSQRAETAYRLTTSVLIATPTFFVALLALLVFALGLGIAPVAGYSSLMPEGLAYLWLPALVICVGVVPVLSRVIKSSVRETMGEEFVEAAIARGLDRPTLFWRYLLRPSIGPSIALMSYIVGQLLGAAVIVELLFDIPGIGRALLDAVAARDYPVVQGIMLVFGLVVVAVGYLSDVVVGWIDPRLAGGGSR